MKQPKRITLRTPRVQVSVVQMVYDSRKPPRGGYRPHKSAKQVFRVVRADVKLVSKSVLAAIAGFPTTPPRNKKA